MRGSPLYKTKTKNMKKKDIIGLQRYKQTKVNPHWWVNSKIERAVARYIKTKTCVENCIG